MWDQLPQVERDLRTAMGAYPAVGFAANQLGHDFRVFIMVRSNDTYAIFINPEIVSGSGIMDADWEGCMSIPDKKALVERRINVVISHQVGKKGKRKITILHDYEARIAQHEIDHLDGVTILDRAIEVVDVDRAADVS